MQALASAFAGGAFRELVMLKLGYNPIGDAGVTAFAAALENGALPALKVLSQQSDRRRGYEGDDGGGWLWAANVDSLNLAGNDYGEEAVEALAVAISGSSLASHNMLVVDEACENRRLKAACDSKVFSSLVCCILATWTIIAPRTTTGDLGAISISSRCDPDGRVEAHARVALLSEPLLDNQAPNATSCLSARGVLLPSFPLSHSPAPAASRSQTLSYPAALAAAAAVHPLAETASRASASSTTSCSTSRGNLTFRGRTSGSFRPLAPTLSAAARAATRCANSSSRAQITRRRRTAGTTCTTMRSRRFI